MKKGMLFGLSHREKTVKRWICYIFQFYLEKFSDFRIAGTVHWFCICRWTTNLIWVLPLAERCFFASFCKMAYLFFETFQRWMVLNRFVCLRLFTNEKFRNFENLTWSKPLLSPHFLIDTSMLQVTFCEVFIFFYGEKLC